jgi:hypothetical protein
MAREKNSGRRWTAWKLQTVMVQGEEQLLYHNNRYHVFVRFTQPEGVPYRVVHLSIKNNDRSARRDWRDFQRIKNEIVGPEREMVELYPRESGKVDLSNQYHLWGYDTERSVFTEGGLGWTGKRLVWNGISEKPPIPDTDNAQQRPNPEEESTQL